MIKYKLVCKNCDLTFDSWFASSKEYEKLKKKNFLNCHKCNSSKVEKSTDQAVNQLDNTLQDMAVANYDEKEEEQREKLNRITGKVEWEEFQ